VILVDDRIGSKHLATPLGKLHPVSLERLDFADIAFKSKEGKQIGIEIKSIRELLGDVFTERFTGHQLPGLIDTYDWVYLLVEGRFKPDPRTAEMLVPQGGFYRPIRWGKGHVNYRTFVKRLNSLAILGNIRVVHTGMLSETVSLILALYQWWQEGFRKHKSLEAFYVAPTKGLCIKKPSTLRRMLHCIDGIGGEKSKILEGVFSSLGAVCRATEEELSEIPGIGPTLAKEIHRCLR